MVGISTRVHKVEDGGETSGSGWGTYNDAELGGGSEDACLVGRKADFGLIEGWCVVCDAVDCKSVSICFVSVIMRL